MLKRTVHKQSVLFAKVSLKGFVTTKYYAFSATGSGF